MSTLATANLSSDESDTEFIPEAPKSKRSRKPRAKRVGSGSASDSSSCSSSSASEGEDAEGDERVAKKAKLEEDAKNEAEERRRKAREEFERMKAELSGAPTESVKEMEELVEIKRPRRFAGETIYETVRLRASDPEAVAYFNRLAAKPDHDEDKSDSATKQPLPQQETPTPIPSAPSGQDKSTTDVKADVSVTTSVVVPSVATRPKGPPRRKRQTLEQMSAALDKGKKMTTLEKSQMDWKSHTSSNASMEDELVANRRNGGFLEKKDFLDRVGERRAGAFNEQASTRRK
ncbi:hypothetical protein I312_105760 [Cryptococcus bacillisporus CA1280]|uniref:SWR1-complex protein 5 n=1 Tax=Cryptococcus bacillisporus CA1280 TaxID=1296109 RepID=A0A0D0V9E5_CRYGA|nr:hypothetical protein I312_06671 [Cryptococcus bacillisporus CA1280]